MITVPYRACSTRREQRAEPRIRTREAQAAALNAVLFNPAIDEEKTAIRASRSASMLTILCAFWSKLANCSTTRS